MAESIYICSEWEKQCKKHVEVDKAISKLIQRLTENNIYTKFSCSGFKEDHQDRKGKVAPYICYDKKDIYGKADRKFYGCMAKAFVNKSPFNVNFWKDKDWQCIYFPKKYEINSEGNDKILKPLWKQIEGQLFKCLIEGDI